MSKQSILAITILLFFSNSTFGKEYNWGKGLSVGDNGSFYVDSNNVSRNGNKIKFWNLVDYPYDVDSEGIKYRSKISLVELDCYESTVSIQQMYEFSGAMGTGVKVWSSEYHKNHISSIRPGTVFDLTKDIICSTK